MSTDMARRLLVSVLCLLPVPAGAEDRSVTIIEGVPEPMQQQSAPPPGPATAPEPAMPKPSALPNGAELSLDILPGRSLRVGQQLAFRASSRQPGYLLLFDVDAAGRVTQIYPSATALARFKGPADAINRLVPDKPVTIPESGNPLTGFAFRASLPRGTGVVVAVLSAVPVRTIDFGSDPVMTGTAQDKIQRVIDIVERSRTPEPNPATLNGADGWSFASLIYSID